MRSSLIISFVLATTCSATLRDRLCIRSIICGGRGAGGVVVVVVVVVQWCGCYSVQVQEAQGGGAGEVQGGCRGGVGAVQGVQGGCRGP